MERVRSALFVAKWRLHDHLKYRSRWVSWLLIAAWAATPFARWRRWGYLLAAHRYSYSPFAERKILANLDVITEYSRRALAPGTGIAAPTTSVFYDRALVQKIPVVAGGRVVEKGVLLIKFTDSFVYLWRNFDVERLMKRFYLVLEPSWSGYAQPAILAWLGQTEPVLVQASEARDRAFLQRIDRNLRPLSIGSSDWVDHRVFRPLSTCEKRFDAVLIGDASRTKRIYVYLRAIARIDDPSYHCALVIGDWGHYRAQILALIDYYGVRDRVTVFKRMSQTDLNVLLNESKVNVLLSLKEGSNRALFEGFFSGTPGLLLRENVGVNKDYINEQTGLLVDERALTDKLLFMKDHWQEFQPRSWAIENISFSRSTERIAAEAAAIAEGEGLGFSGPLYEKVNIPEACYPDDPDGSARRRLLAAHLDPFALEPGTDANAAPDWSAVRRDPQTGV